MIDVNASAVCRNIQIASFYWLIECNHLSPLWLVGWCHMTLCCRHFLQQTPQFLSTDSESCRKIERAVYPSVWPRLSSLRPLLWCVMFILNVCFLAERSAMVGCRQYSWRRGEKWTTAADGAGKRGKILFLLINRQDLLLLNGVWQDRKWRRTTLNVQSQMEKKQYVIIHVPPNVGFNSGVIWLDSVLSTRWHTLLSPK